MLRIFPKFPKPRNYSFFNSFASLVSAQLQARAGGGPQQRVEADQGGGPEGPAAPDELPTSAQPSCPELSLQARSGSTKQAVEISESQILTPGVVPRSKTLQCLIFNISLKTSTKRFNPVKNCVAIDCKKKPECDWGPRVRSGEPTPQSMKTYAPATAATGGRQKRMQRTSASGRCIFRHLQYINTYQNVL